MGSAVAILSEAEASDALERARAASREYQARYLATPEGLAKRMECQARYRATQSAKEKRRAAQARFKAKPDWKERSRAYTAKWRAKPGSREKEAETRAKPETKIKRRASEKARYANDARARISHSLRSRVNGWLRGATRSASLTKLVGCSAPELVGHLERLWKPGMSWENYGRKGWHIDHIRPLASFNQLDPAHQAVAWHYSNLQPLWAVENLAKGSGGCR